MTLTVLECRGLSKWYGEVIAVNDLTVDVPEGITGLLGPNGAGKTSLLRLAVGLLKPSQGTVSVLGEDPWGNPRLLKRIGYVPDGHAPWRDRSGRRCAVLAGRLSGLSGDAAAVAADRALLQVGLGDVADRRVDAYSRGMRQKLKVALALLHEPEMLILDEPLTGADPSARRELIAFVRGLAKEGRSVLISTHVLHDVEAMTDRILLLDHGRLMAHGAVGEIRDLLERFPRTIRIGTPQPRAVGAVLWASENALSVQAEENAVVVRTRAPQAFFEELQTLLAERDVPFTSIAVLDDNVDAVFRYLVGER